MEETQENQDATKSNKTKVLDVNLDEIQAVDSSNLDLNPAQYEGFRTKIEKVMIIETINYYNKPVLDDEGKPTGEYKYNPDSTEMCQKVKILTEPLPKLDEEGKPTNEEFVFGNGSKLQVSARFNLTFNVEQQKWTISKHEKAKLWKFMRKMGVENLKELVGKYVTLTTELDRNDDSKLYLRIVC
jgi:hypothetical protein